MLAKIISLVFCVFVIAASQQSFASQLHSLKYDIYFKQAMSWHMPGVDWKLLKAQCYQESRFKPKAVSPVGAMGLCQFMPATWQDVPMFIREGSSAFDERANITAAAWYNSKLFQFWHWRRPELEKIKLMLASYNAGAANVSEAQKLCDMAINYDPIIKCLPDVTGHHSKETIHYVKSITKFWSALSDDVFSHDCSYGICRGATR